MWKAASRRHFARARVAPLQTESAMKSLAAKTRTRRVESRLICTHTRDDRGFWSPAADFELGVAFGVWRRFLDGGRHRKNARRRDRGQP